MPETGITFICPLCGVAVPIPHTDTPTADGLSVTFDDTYTMEHMVMHADCTCQWTPTSDDRATITATDPNCRFHAA